MPGRPLHRHPDELTELTRAFGAQPRRRPRYPLEVLANLRQQMLDMPLARRLIGLHATEPYSDDSHTGARFRSHQVHPR